MEVHLLRYGREPLLGRRLWRWRHIVLALLLLEDCLLDVWFWTAGVSAGRIARVESAFPGV
eukprot:5249079-Prorocentrum_lima.AAC.1